MGLQQSKDEQLHLAAAAADVDAVKALRRQGAGLEWLDKEGKTPLIAACLRFDAIHVAHVLLELGANVDAYRPGSQAGTPLHHAAKKGLEQTVKLLLSYGANVLRMNDDCKTPLELAREKGHCNIVRTIESQISFFSGYLREFYGPGFLEALAPKWISRKIWAVVLQRDQRNPPRLELAIYPTVQASQPLTVIALAKVDIEEPNFNQPDPMVVVFDKSNRKRYKFLSADEANKQQLLLFYGACKGLIQHSPSISLSPEGQPVVSSAPSIPAATQSSALTIPSEDAELVMAINASIQSVEGLPYRTLAALPTPQGNDANGWANTEDTPYGGWGPLEVRTTSGGGANGWANEPQNDTYNGWEVPGSTPSTSVPSRDDTQQPTSSQGHDDAHNHTTVAVPPAEQIPTTTAAPSAPPIIDEAFADVGIHYPQVDSSPLDFRLTATDSKHGAAEQNENYNARGTCVVCLDAPVEGACIPCGHMAGCMPCLNEIKKKEWGCPVCRANIDQVIKLYSV